MSITEVYAMPTFEHVLPFLVMYDCPRLQVLRLQPVGDSNGFWLGRTGLYGLLLLLLSTLLRLHLRLLLGHGLLAQSSDVFLNRDTVFRRLGL